MLCPPHPRGAPLNSSCQRLLACFLLLVLAALGRHRREGFSLAASRGCSLVAVCGLLTAVALLAAELGL